MRHFYILPGIVDEQKIRVEAEGTYIHKGEATTLHKHHSLGTCNNHCYVWPKTHVDDDDAA